MLAFWREHETFEKTLAMSADRPRFSFNEGPPTANGKPGIHHVLARTFKDLFPRYKTMRGYFAPRKAGWDTHGLPVEHEVEKHLKNSGLIESYDKEEIESKVGIAEFTRLCRESVMTYIGDWEKMTERMGFWVHLDEAYYTLNNSYIESVWYLLKKHLGQGPYLSRLQGRALRSAHWRTLSSHEFAQGYQDTEDPVDHCSLSRRRRGEHVDPRLDDDALDAAVESRARGGSDIDYSYCKARRGNADSRRGAARVCASRSRAHGRQDG